MSELQLKVVKNTDDGVIGKAILNFNRVLYSSGGYLYNIVISTKRNSVLHAYMNYLNYDKISDENKRNSIERKYHKAYDNYMSTLEKYVVETIYNKVKKKTAMLKENKIMSQYYEINSLKGNEYVEYKHRKQVLLLDMDWDIIMSTKNDFYVQKYKNFYVDTMEQLYKSIMRHYAILLTDPKVEGEQKYNKIYELIESYIKIVLPYTSESEDKQKILEAYKKYVMSVDVYSKQTYNTIKKKLILLELSRRLFLYSLPMIAAEECYVKLIKETRNTIVNTFIDADKFELYELLLDLIESYNVNVLSQKVYWDSPAIREEYNKFWEKFKELKKIERIDYDEYKRKREILFITYDIKLLKRSKKNYDDIKAYYRNRMKQIHGFRKLKNTYKKIDGRWRTLRRMPI